MDWFAGELPAFFSTAKFPAGADPGQGDGRHLTALEAPGADKHGARATPEGLSHPGARGFASKLEAVFQSLEQTSGAGRIPLESLIEDAGINPEESQSLSTIQDVERVDSGGEGAVLPPGGSNSPLVQVDSASPEYVPEALVAANSPADAGRYSMTLPPTGALANGHKPPVLVLPGTAQHPVFTNPASRTLLQMPVSEHSKVDVLSNPAPANLSGSQDPAMRILPEQAKGVFATDQAAPNLGSVTISPDDAEVSKPDVPIPNPRSLRESAQPLPVLKNAVAAAVVQENLMGNVLDNVAQSPGRGEQVLTSLVNSQSAAETPVQQAPASASGAGLASGGVASVSLLQEPLPVMQGSGGSDKPPVSLLQVPMGDPGWEAELEARVRWLMERGGAQAELRLNPAHLGSLVVNISEDGETTNILFFAQNPQARELLEGSLLKLQEMLQEEGMNLADTEVSDQPYGQQGAGDQETVLTERALEADPDQYLGENQPISPPSQDTSGVDLYA